MKIIVLANHKNEIILLDKITRFYFGDYCYLYADIVGGDKCTLCHCTEKEGDEMLKKIADFLVSDEKVLRIEK